MNTALVSLSTIPLPAPANGQTVPEWVHLVPNGRVQARDGRGPWHYDDPYVLRNFQLGFGNDVQGRFLIGEEEIVIVDRSDMIEMQIKAVPLATLDPFALARDQTAVPVQLVHGTSAGNVATLDVPEAQGIKEWPLRMVPLPGAGNDQWTLTLS